MPLGRSARVLLRAGLVIVRVVDILAPLGHVAVHVEEAPRIGLLLADGMRLLGGVVGEPGEVAELPRFVAERVVGIGPGPAGVFPFRLGRQPVAVRLEIALAGVLVVARLESFEARPGVAEAGRLRPGHLFHRQVRPLEMGRVGEGLDLAELFVLGLGHLVLVHQERVDPDLVHGLLLLAAVPAPHLEGAGRNEDHLAAALGRDRRQPRRPACGSAGPLTAREAPAPQA